MALVTYADLETAIINWLARDDLNTFVPDFITLFEADANAKLSSRQQTLVTTGVCVNQQITLPSDFLDMLRVTWKGSVQNDLDFKEPEQMAVDYPVSSAAGIPEAYTIEGQVMTILPADNTTTIEYAYRQKIGPLANATNWLWTRYPNVYLWGSLAEAQGFAMDPDKLSLWTQRRDDIYSQIMRVDFRSGAGLTIRPHGYTP